MSELDDAISAAVESIIDNWDDWEADAGQAAQQAQDIDAWRCAMTVYLSRCLYRHLEKTT